MSRPVIVLIVVGAWCVMIPVAIAIAATARFYWGAH